MHGFMQIDALRFGSGVRTPGTPAPFFAYGIGCAAGCRQGACDEPWIGWLQQGAAEESAT